MDTGTSKIQVYLKLHSFSQNHFQVLLSTTKHLLANYKVIICHLSDIVQYTVQGKRPLFLDRCKIAACSPVG